MKNLSYIIIKYIDRAFAFAKNIHNRGEGFGLTNYLASSKTSYRLVAQTRLILLPSLNQPKYFISLSLFWP